jgi:hypothetical protein
MIYSLFPEHEIIAPFATYLDPDFLNSAAGPFSCRG